MESATQIDLAKDEDSAGQVLQSVPCHALEDAAVVSAESHATFSASPAPKRSIRGAMSTTNQVRLQPKSKVHTSLGSATIDSNEPDPFGETGSFVELQPVDRGFGAWSYITAAFSMYIVVWGFPQAFPIFQTYLSTGEKANFPDSVAIRLLAPGLQDIEEGILFPLLPTHGRHRRLLVLLGIFTIAVSLILASYAQQDWQIVLAQGVFFGIGGILLNFVHVSVFSEWFDKKKGQAMGIVWTGWRLGALAFPLLCQWLLEQRGFEQTVRVLIAPMISLLLPCIFLLRGRYHSATISLQPSRKPVSKWEALSTPSVLYYLFATCLFYLIVNVPKMFITTFAADLGLKGSDQAITLVLLNISDMMGTYLCGHVSDLIYHEGLTACLAITTAVANLLGFGFAKSREGAYLYAIAVGLTSGGFTNCLFTFYGDTSKGDGELFTAIHSIFSFFRGAAILSVGPIGAELLKRAPKMDLANFASSRYLYLLAYSVTLSFSSGVLIAIKYVRRRLLAQP